MSYNGSTGKISAPVSVYDVMQALGVSNNDVGSLCRSEQIRRWSKFKPVNIGGTYGGSTYINTIPLLNMTTKKWDETLSFQWWRDTNRKNNLSRYGFLPIVGTTIKAIFDAYNQGDDWVYYVPEGGANYPFRLIDFNGYYHYAPEPAGIEVGNWTQVLQGSWSFTFDLIRSQDDALPVTQRDYIIPEDILKTLWGISTVYYGLAIVDATTPSNPTLVYAVTSATISGTGTTVGTASLSYDHDYYIIPFFANGTINGASLGGKTIALVPNSSMGVMHTAQSGQPEDGNYILKAVFTVTGRLVVNTAISTEWSTGIQYPAHTFRDVTMYVCKAGTVAPATGAPSSSDVLYKQEYYDIYIEANSRWDAAPWDARPTQDSVICFLYEDGKKRVTANAVKPQPIEPPTPTL